MVNQEQQVGGEATVSRLLLLREAVRTFNSSLDLDVVFQHVLEKVISVLSAEAASIWLIQEPTKELICQTAIGPVKDKVKGLKLPWGTGIVGWVSQNAKPVIVSDAQRDQFLSKQVDSDTGFVTRSMICAPMVVRGKCLGAIQIVNKVPSTTLFVKDDLDILVELAIDAAIAVENARLYQAESKVKELQALFKISREITSTLDLDRILKIVVNILSNLVSYERGSIALNENGWVSVNAISGQEKIDLKSPDVKRLHDFLADLSVPAGATLFSRDDQGATSQRMGEQDSPAPETAARFMSDLELGSLLVLPLRDEEGLVGQLCLEAKTTQAFNPSQLEIINILAGQVTVAIRNAQLYRQVPTLSLKALPTLFSWQAMSRKRVYWLGGVATLLTALFLIRMPLLISGRSDILSADQLPLCTREGGVVEAILIQQGDTVKAGQILARMDDRDLNLELRSTQTDLDVSRIRVKQLRLSSDAGAIALEELKIQQLEEAVALLRSKIENAVLRAPINGLVLTPKLQERVGDTLPKGAELIKLANTDQMTAEIDVSEADIAEITVGLPVAVRLLAFPARVFNGHVTLVSPQGKPDTKAGAKFQVTARLDNHEGLLRAGMGGTAKIETPARSLMAALCRAPAAWLQMYWWRIKP